TRACGLPLLGRQPIDGKSPLLDLSRNNRRPAETPHSATCPSISPQSNFVPSGENAAVSTQPGPRGFPGATNCLNCRPVCTSKIVIRGLGARRSPAATSLPVGERANERMLPGVRSRSVPIRARARGGRDGLAISVLGGLLGCSLAPLRTGGASDCA